MPAPHNQPVTGRRLRPAAKLLLALWMVLATGLGAVLASLHQPFRTPAPASLRLLAGTPAHGRWVALHLVSPSCACSQTVMQHLAQRRPSRAAEERVVLVEDRQATLPGTAALLGRLQAAGYSLQHLQADRLPAGFGLRGVPLLSILAPDGRIAYLGGYRQPGAAAPQDEFILASTLAGQAVEPRPVLGCAVGRLVRRRADPLGLKYAEGLFASLTDTPARPEGSAWQTN